jgi:hypothetical protein
VDECRDDGRRWPADQLRLLCQIPDEDVAAKVGRTLDAVRQQGERLAIPKPDGGRWTDEEIALLGTAPDEEVAARAGRSVQAVRLKR